MPVRNAYQLVILSTKPCSVAVSLPRRATSARMRGTVAAELTSGTARCASGCMGDAG